MSEAKGPLGYFTISVPDVQRGKTFYARVLGWEYDPDSGGQDAGSTYAHIHDSSPAGGLYDGKEHPGFQPYFVVDDIETAVATVREMGGEAADPSESDSGWSAACTDDQGTRFSLWQPAPGFLG